MLTRSSVLWILIAVLLALAPVQLTGPATTASAQVQRGATLTVLRGEVAVVRSDGSAVQPAPSGTTVDTGDEIRTLTKAGALITFFAGTEIEMGEGTILAVDEITRNGDRVNVSLKQVLGVTLNRVQTLGSTGSTYQIDAGGAVAVVRGTTFALAGPTPTAVGNVVALACLEDCGPSSTLGGCAMQPFMGIGVVVSQGKVASGCQTFAVGHNEGLFDAAVQGITTTEQAVQGGNPGQQVLGFATGTGRPNESNSHSDRDNEREEDNNGNPNTAILAEIETPHGPIQIILTWSSGEDLDAHLSGPQPNGGRFHAFFGNSRPVPYATLDRDVVVGPGTETITITNNPPTNAQALFVPGEYRYWVHNFSGTGFPANLNATVTVRQEGAILGTFRAPTASSSQNIWFALRLVIDEFGHPAITFVNQLITAPGGFSGSSILP